MKKTGLIIVISAPSGAGKTTLCKRLVRRLPTLTYSISFTTRPPRQGEHEGINYFFVSEARFQRMVKERRFVEWARVHGCFYGTPKRFLERTIRAGCDVILDIDVQGGRKIKAAYPDAVMLFVMTPSFKELELRLRSRKKDSDAVIRKRLANARKEVRAIRHYSYLVINDDISQAVDEICCIINAEHHRLRNGSKKSF